MTSRTVRSFLSLVFLGSLAFAATACSVDSRDLVPGTGSGVAGTGGAAGAGLDASVGDEKDGSGSSAGGAAGGRIDGSGGTGGDEGGGSDGGICRSGELRCSPSGIPQKCNASGTAFEDQDLCPTDAPVCDAATGTCAARCAAGAKRCNAGSANIQQCDLQGIWQDTTVCPFACTGTGEASACTGSCKPGARTCGANNTPFLCDATGTNQMEAPCATACTGAGECSGDCKPNATRCASGAPNRVETCDATGKWGPATACTFVCDATKQDCGGECAPGMANRCSSSTVQSCDATGHWKDMTACAPTPCSMGECRACTQNQKQCNVGKPQTCSAAGAWVDDQATACPFVCDAATGKCAGECVPDSDACAANSTKHCGANGVYSAASACTNICDAATGKCGGVCVPNARRCNSTTSQTCGANGQWGSDMACPFGCAAVTGMCNACTDEPMTTTCSVGKCGPTTNNCGHTVQCSATCAGTGQTCGGAGVPGVCGCSPEASTQTCQNGTKCGSVLNNCGQAVPCATCTLPQTCGGGTTPSVCGCTKESDAALCARITKTCGTLTAADNCGILRTVPSCGTCNAMQQCTSNTCQCLPAFTGPSCSVPRFEGIGPTNFDGGTRGVSADGTIVVSDSYNTNDEYTTYIWTRATSTTSLMTAVAARQINVRGQAISGNGAVIVGFFDSPPTRGFRWTSAGKAVELGPLPAGDTTYAAAASNDGSVVVGTSNKAALGSIRYPCRWINGVVSEVPGFSGSAQGSAKDVSDNGNVIVGESDQSGFVVPSRWTVTDGNALPVPLPVGEMYGTASSVSGNGLVIVGWAGTSTYTAWRWSSAGGTTIIPGASLGSAQPLDTNVDGTVVIGGSANGPWIWDATSGVRLLPAWFTSLGINYTGWTIAYVDAISHDGKVLVGSGLSPTGKYRGWIARLP